MNKRVVIISRYPQSAYQNRRMRRALEALNIQVEICHPDDFTVMLGSEPAFTYRGKPFVAPDLVFARTGAGTKSHAATLFRAMNAAGAKVVNPVSAIQAAMDKILTYQIASNVGLPIPKTLVRSARDGGGISWDGTFPVIVKLATGSHGVGTLKCETANDLKATVDLISALDPTRPFLIQEYIRSRPGVDVRILAIGGKVLGAMMRSAKAGEFRAGISTGGSGETFELTPEVVRLTETIVKQMKLTVAGVDLLFDGDGFVLCEVNSAPGFRGFETYCGVDVAGKIAEYISEQI